MDLHDFPPNMIEKAKQATTAEELLTLAKANGIDLTTEQAGFAFATLHKTGELADDELDQVAGGRIEPRGTGKSNHC